MLNTFLMVRYYWLINIHTETIFLRYLLPIIETLIGLHLSFILLLGNIEGSGCTTFLSWFLLGKYLIFFVVFNLRSGKIIQTSIN